MMEFCDSDKRLSNGQIILKMSYEVNHIFETDSALL